MTRRFALFTDTESEDILLWTRAYCAAAVAAVVLLVFLISGWFADARQSLPVIRPERINPNSAPLGSLVRLPGIGKARALDVIHYRQSQQTYFTTADDLQAIRGIGPKTAENIAPWLEFESNTHNR